MGREKWQKVIGEWNGKNAKWEMRNDREDNENCQERKMRNEKEGK